MMITTSASTSPAEIGEKDLRARINRSVSKALSDRAYAQLLLADPTVVLDDHGCSPQQYMWLRSISAESLDDFARQALALFWVTELAPTDIAPEERLPRAASAAH
jgi:hypothetical protein